MCILLCITIIFKRVVQKLHKSQLYVETFVAKFLGAVDSNIAYGVGVSIEDLDCEKILVTCVDCDAFEY